MDSSLEFTSKSLSCLGFAKSTCIMDNAVLLPEACFGAHLAILPLRGLTAAGSQLCPSLSVALSCRKLPHSRSHPEDSLQPTISGCGGIFYRQLSQGLLQRTQLKILQLCTLLEELAIQLCGSVFLTSLFHPAHFLQIH